MHFNHEYESLGRHRLVVVRALAAKPDDVGEWAPYQNPAYVTLHDAPTVTYFTVTDYWGGGPFEPGVVYELVKRGTTTH